MKALETKKTVVFTRSNSIIFDSRVIKEVNTALKGNYKVSILGWNREEKDISSSDFYLNNEVAELRLFKMKSGYGNGLRNLPKLLIFQLWLFYQLVIIRRHYSIIHSCDFDTVIPCFLASKLFNKKLIYDIFDYYIHSHSIPRSVEAIIEKLEIKIINSANTVIICNENRLKQIKKTSPKKVEIIHNTPSLEQVKYAYRMCKSQNDKLKIVYVGILQNDRLLAEIAEQIANYDYVELHIGGYGILESYFENLSQETKNVYYYGQLNYSQVLQLESECDVLLATYNPEIRNHKFSAPNKLYEAMALKKPIIVCNGTSADEIVNKHKMGISIDYSAHDFFNAISFLAENNDARILMGNCGRKAYDEDYNYEIMENRLLNVYSEL